MHDVLLKLGRDIVTQENDDPRKCSRLWDANDVCRVLTTKGTGKLQSISLNLSPTTEINLSPAAFKGLYNLRLLKFYCSDYQPPENLKSMDLRYSSMLILNDLDFSKVPNLEVLILKPRDMCFVSLPSSIKHCTKLVKLDLSCRSLICLPDSIGELKSLEELHLQHCSELASLPDNIGELKSLVELELDCCTKLASLPESIGELKCLERLDLIQCYKLESLPNSIHVLESLISLRLVFCHMLNRFPSLNPRCSEVEEIASTTNKLGCLRFLIVNACGVLEIPGSIGSLASLTSLRLLSNDFERIPASIKQLPVLTELHLSGCERLQHLPQLPSSLQVLGASDCISLTSVEGIFMQGEKDYEAASQEFNFSGCPQLDQNSLTKIIGDARLRIQRMATSLFNQQYFGEPVSVRLCIPGSEVPEWFTYKNTEGPTVKIKLPDHCHRANTTDQLFGFTLCAVVSFGNCLGFPLRFDIKCECHLITKDGTQSDLTFHYNDAEAYGTWEREEHVHVFIWSIQSHCSFKEASFHFKALNIFEETDHYAVVQSGVHPLFVEPEQPQPKRLKLMGNYILL